MLELWASALVLERRLLSLHLIFSVNVKRGGFTITPSRPVLDMVHRKADRTARPRQDTGLCRERGVQDRARVSPLMIENSGK